MAEELRDSQQFHVNELVIVSKGESIDIKEIFSELNLFDSLYMPVMSGKLII